MSANVNRHALFQLIGSHVWRIIDPMCRLRATARYVVTKSEYRISTPGIAQCRPSESVWRTCRPIAPDSRPHMFVAWRTRQKRIIDENLPFIVPINKNSIRYTSRLRLLQSCIFVTETKTRTKIITIRLLKLKQEAQLMLTTGSTRLAVSRGQQIWYHSTCNI